jgi:hypothetical protein
MSYAVQIKLEELEKVNAAVLKDNKELRHIIAAHAGQIERNKNALFQLFGGLYNPITQKRILKQHLNSLLGEDEAADEAADGAADGLSSLRAEPLEDIWPTTRQGDLHEERINALEEQFNERNDTLTEQLEVLEENLTQIFRERDDQLTLMETRLQEMEAKINAMEKNQLERLGLNM